MFLRNLKMNLFKQLFVFNSMIKGVYKYNCFNMLKFKCMFPFQNKKYIF